MVRSIRTSLLALFAFIALLNFVAAHPLEEAVVERSFNPCGKSKDCVVVRPSEDEDETTRFASSNPRPGAYRLIAPGLKARPKSAAAKSGSRQKTTSSKVKSTTKKVSKSTSKSKSTTKKTSSKVTSTTTPDERHQMDKKTTTSRKKSTSTKTTTKSTSTRVTTGRAAITTKKRPVIISVSSTSSSPKPSKSSSSVPSAQPTKKPTASTTTTTAAMPSSTADNSPSAQQAVVDAHNAYRAKHGAPALTWDNKLAEYAKNWASQCIWAHSGGPYGENGAATVGLEMSMSIATDMWYDEIQYYNFSQPDFSEATGHFTQLIWEASHTIGCAIVPCQPSKLGFNWPYSDPAYNVWCEYSQDPGNVIGIFAENVQPPQGVTLQNGMVPAGYV